MKECIKEYLRTESKNYGMKIDFRHSSDVDLFCYFLYFKERMTFPDYIASIILEYAKGILDCSEDKIKRTNEQEELMYRIKDLKSGEVGLDDFTDGKELAEWLIKGVLK